MRSDEGYLGSRPRQQAIAEVRNAGLTGMEYVNYARHRAAEFREDHRSASARPDDATGWPVPAPQTSSDWDMSMLSDDLSDDVADEELLDEMGRESFPSSDPPSTWAGRDSFPRGARH